MSADNSTHQNALLAAIFDTSSKHDFDERGLAIYRSNLRATAERSLAITFPTIQALVGEDIMRYATEELLQCSPPDHGDWARWGKQLPQVLAQIDALADYPFIEDCAALDYLCHQSIRAADTQQDLSSLSVLEQAEPDDIYVQLAPSFSVFASDYPIASLRSAHKLAGEARRDALQALLADIHAGNRHYFASYQQSHELRIDNISADDYRWYQQLQQHSLGAALDALADSDWAFDQWLAPALQQGIVSRFHTQ